VSQTLPSSLPQPETWQRLRVVLVRPAIAGNLGATARVLANFAIRDWWLVDPRADPEEPQARTFAARAGAMLRQLRRADRLEQALAECVLVVGTSSVASGTFRGIAAGLPWDIAPRMLDAAASGPVALVFGPEVDGLTNAELALCHYLMRIPTDAAYPAMNLSHSVAVCVYELRRHLLVHGAKAQAKPIASFAEQNLLFQHLEQALRELHFLWKPNADCLMYALRHVLSRAEMTPLEVRMLHGLARQIIWKCRQSGSHPPPPGQQTEAG